MENGGTPAMDSQCSHYHSARSAIHSPWAALIAAAIGISTSIGCGKSDNRAPVFPVRGEIHFKGQAPTGAFIVLHPKSGPNPDAPSPRAMVGPDGSFALSTYNGQDGAPEGEYVLTVQWNKLVKQGNDVVSGPNVLPAKYASPRTSDIKITVASSENRLKPIQLR
jgi:hypothetical protein